MEVRNVGVLFSEILLYYWCAKKTVFFSNKVCNSSFFTCRFTTGL